uniref:G-protein coupled receptors family 2 profile 2 domain-containing protein n=1 Tax=Anopheles atroparvus TaxID=41427 RepID=A0A182IYC9_ANOAO
MTKVSSYQRATIRPRPHGCLWQRAWSFVMVVLYCGISFGIDDVKGAVLCPPEEAVEISAGTLNDDGSIEHDGVLYALGQHFYNGSTVLGCVCLVRQCVRICCPELPEYLPGTSCKMGALNVNFSTPLDDGTEGFRMVNLLEDSKYHYLYTKPKCVLLTLYEDEYVLRADGQLAYGPSLFPYRQFCLQEFDTSALAGYCETVDALAPHRWYSIGIIVSLPFLVATFVVYALLPEMQNIPGKSLMCYVAALTVGYLLVALMRFNVYGYQTGWCIGTGYVVYCALLASFFWLNVMAFDIFWTFGGSRGRTSERRKFLYYSLYAWGFPLALVGWAVLVDHTDFMHHSMRPQFGYPRCFFRGDMLIGFVYMYLPMALLVGANVVFFAVTAFRIYRMEQATASALSGDSRRHTKYAKDSYRFSLYLRLFIIMGVTWTVEFITWLIGETTVLIYLVDICNCMTGILIFILFVWKQKVKDLLLKRFGRQPAAPYRDPNTNSTITATRTTDVKLNADHDVPLTGMTHVN